MSPLPTSGSRGRLAWGVLGVLLALESLLLVWVTGMTVTEAIVAADYVVQSVSLVVMSACALLWVLITCWGALRSRASWVRGSSLTIHVLLFAAGTGCLQLGIGTWQFGFALVGAALAGFVAAIAAKPAAQPEPEVTPN